MTKPGPKPTCVCGECRKCRNRLSARRRYQGVVYPKIAVGRYKPKMIAMPNDPATLGYLAGLLDGEGAIIRSNKCIYVQIAMTDRPVIEWLGELGGTVIERKVTGNRRRVWCWKLMRQRDVWAFLLALFPLLRVKRAKAEEAVLDIWGRELMREELFGETITEACDAAGCFT